MIHQNRRHAAIEYARLERLHSNLEEWNHSPRKKVTVWIALSAVAWAPIIAAIIYFLKK